MIAPELARAFPGRFAVGVLLPPASRAHQPRFGFRIWPAIVMLADGKYVGAIEGLRNWDEYVAELAELLEAAAFASADDRHRRERVRRQRGTRAIR